MKLSSRDNIFRGRAGEFYAAYVLESSGLRTTHVDLPSDDLWCVNPLGKMFRVQVKTAAHALLHSKWHTTPKYNFKISQNLFDYDGVFIFVAQDIKRLLCRNGTNIRVQSIKIAEGNFTQEAQDLSIKEAFLL